MIRKILVFGPQGSGKGTQAELLAKKLGVLTFGMGQLCREEIASGSDVGKKIDGIIKSGNLVSDHIAADLLKKRLAQPDTKNGYVLDGYPRNLQQYGAFDFDRPSHVILLEVPREESLKRLGNRLTCNKCNKVYRADEGHALGQACACGGTLQQRDDDTPAAITRRLEVYEKDTRPVIAEYEKQGIVRRVDGVGSVEEVFHRIIQQMG